MKQLSAVTMHTTRGTHTKHNTDTTQSNTTSMSTTRGSSFSGASAVDQAGGGQQPDPSMDVDPTNNVIDVDEDNDQTQAEPILFRYIHNSLVPEGELLQLLILVLHARIAEKKSYNELRARIMITFSVDEL